MSPKLKNTSPVSIYDLHINKTWVSRNVSFGKNGFKCLNGFKDGIKFRSLCVMLPKMSAFRRDFDETKYMSILIKMMNF